MLKRKLQQIEPISGLEHSANRWAVTPAGRYIGHWEQSQLNQLTGDIFGYFALELNQAGVAALQANRMPNRVLVQLSGQIDESLNEEKLAQDVDQVSGSTAQSRSYYTHHIVLDSWRDLPFLDESIDLLVMVRTLDQANDPHAVLREAFRVLRPEGRIFISGINPVSLWGARALVPRWLWVPFLPQQRQLISVPRLRDWLKLLTFELDKTRYGCFAPALRTTKWLERYAAIERIGDQLWPICGAAYLVSATKRVPGMRLIGPTRRLKRSGPTHVVAPVAQSLTPQQDFLKEK
jgi:SAM-dependent methyltransferase